MQKEIAGRNIKSKAYFFRSSTDQLPVKYYLDKDGS